MTTDQHFIVEYEGRRYPVASLREASQKWDTFREQTGAGASQLGRATIRNQDGIMIGRIVYNGRIELWI